MRTLDFVEWNFIEPRPAAFDDRETAVAHDLTIARRDGDFSTRTDGRRGVLICGTMQAAGRGYERDNASAEPLPDAKSRAEAMPA